MAHAVEAPAMEAGLLAGRVAFITGAARGIGRAIAERYVQEGAAVVLGDIDGPAVATAAAEVGRVGGGSQASAVVVDVTSLSSLGDALSECLVRHGRVDSVVANAGILHLQHVLDTPLDRWRRVLEVNLTGAFLTCQIFGRQLVEQGQGGSMILTSSLFGVRGGVENGAYSASKFGLIGLMQSLAAELAPHGILVNAVCPGQVDTDMMRALFRDRAALRGQTEGAVQRELEQRVPLGRLASVSEIADIYVFLASRLNHYITGQSLVADGGWLVGPA
ncbi:MAG TPA: SDR family NAD(P)-dependent oxidoreductase [Chloroflexota bacterium]